MSLSEQKAAKVAYDAARHQDTRLQHNESSRKWRLKNQEKAREHTRRWRAAQDVDLFRAKMRSSKAEWMSIPENRMRHCLGQAKRRAAKSRIDFDICISDLLPLPTSCPVLGVPINYSGTKARGFANNSPSIDRINSKFGYVKGNVKVICWRANRIKSDATKEELEKILEYMANPCN